MSVGVIHGFASAAAATTKHSTQNTKNDFILKAKKPPTTHSVLFAELVSMKIQIELQNLLVF